MTAQSLRGILFDKDGTLFDFAASWASVLDDTLVALTDDSTLRHVMARDAGYDPVRRRFVPGSPCVAGAVEEIAAVWARHLPERSVSEIEVIANQFGETAGSRGALAPAVPDLPAFLRGLRDDGFVLGIATHDSEAAAHAHLGAVDALDCFAFIAGYDSGHGLKPGPGMLLAFAAATELRPDEIVMVGDSVHDLGVAPAAGAAMAVGVLTGPATREDLAPHADHVLDSIADLPALLMRGL